MARDAKFLFQFISDFWDLLPSEDRDWLAVYWHALIQVVSDIYQETFEANLATSVQDVQVFRKELWNRFQLNENTADIQTISETITLTGTTSVSLAQDAVMWDTLQVTDLYGVIGFSEIVELTETDMIDLEYDNLVTGTVRVRENLANGTVFTQGRDYTVNLTTGMISRTARGGISDGAEVVVSYNHPYYEETTDFVLDRELRTIARSSSSNIPSGLPLTVSYDYDNDEQVPYGGTAIADTSDDSLEDTEKDFTGIMTGRTVTITSGLNAGTYTVASVISSVKITVTPSLVADDNAAVYSINAFPYTISVDSGISSIPAMQDLIVDPTEVFLEDVDYIVGSGKISFREIPPVIRESDGPTLWAEETFVDEETVYRNFGVLIDFYRESSEAYLLAVQGLWYAYWTGPTDENLLRSLQILLGLPFANTNATVKEISQEESFLLDISPNAQITTPTTFSYASSTFTQDDVGRTIRISNSTAGNDGDYVIESVTSPTTVEIESSPAFTANEGPGGYTAELLDIIDSVITLADSDGVESAFDVPSGLEAIVEVGDAVDQFDRLTTGVRLFTKINEPGFVASRLGRFGIQRFLTQNASTGVGNSDETKALTLLEEHLFIAQALVEGVSEAVNTDEVFTFLENLRPQWNEFVFSFANDITETLTFVDDDFTDSLLVDLTTTVHNAWLNYARADQVAYQGSCDISYLVNRALVGGFSIDVPAKFTAAGSTFTDADVGRYINVSGAASGGNDGYREIYKVLSTTEVLVTPDFVASESGGGLAANVEIIQQLTDTSATFTTDAQRGDIIKISDGPNVGYYEVLEVVSNTVLYIWDKNVDGPFEATETGRDFDLISAAWALDADAVNLEESYLHERTDGATVNATTFRVDSSVDLDEIDVRVGLNLIIKSGANLGLYEIASIVNDTDFTISSTFPSSPLGSQDYSISSVAAHMVNATAPPNDEALPI